MNFMTTGEVAAFFNTDVWRIRRFFEDGTLPEPERFIGKRAIHRKDLPKIKKALQERGWLTDAMPLQETTSK